MTPIELYLLSLRNYLIYYTPPLYVISYIKKLLKTQNKMTIVSKESWEFRPFVHNYMYCLFFVNNFVYWLMTKKREMGFWQLFDTYHYYITLHCNTPIFFFKYKRHITTKKKTRWQKYEKNEERKNEEFMNAPHKVGNA